MSTPRQGHDADTGLATWHVVWFRFRATFHRRRGSYLALILLVALVGGLAMGAVAGARRTQSSFPSYMAGQNAAQLGQITSVVNPEIGSTVGYNPATVRAIRALPAVSKVESDVGIDVLPLGRNGAPYSPAGFPTAAGNGLGSVDGDGFDMDRYSVIRGRLPDPGRAGEVAVLSEVAQMAGFRLGQRFTLGVYTNAQTNEPTYGTAALRPYRTVEVTVVGIVVSPLNIVHDDVDNGTSLMIFTPAFTKPLLGCCVNYAVSYVQVKGGPAAVSTVINGVVRLLPKQFPDPQVGSSTIDKAERAVKPESIALGVFGAIAALAALLIAAQMIGRQLRMASEELETLRALGAPPAMTTLDGWAPLAGSVVAGAVLAVGVAVAFSPLAPLGPVRAVNPTPGVFFDWTVLGFGPLIAVTVLGAVGALLAYRAVPRAGARRAGREPRRSRAVAAAAGAGLSPSAVAGVRFALEPGAGRTSVPVRSAILGTVLALMVTVGTVTFGASLNSLVAHPRLYGWNWDYVLSGGGGSGDIPAQTAQRLLAHDPYVASWSAADFDDLRIDGQFVPVIGEPAGAAVQPPILSGHGLEGTDQVVLGAITLAQLHAHVGGTVRITPPGEPARTLHVAGTATMPTIGGPGPHLEMGEGAVVAYDLIPPAARNPFNDPQTGPENIFVNLKPGVNRAAALRSLNRITQSLSNNFNFGVFAQNLLRPAEIVNYRSLGTTPAVLGGALALGAVVALGLTLLSSVRRRQRDLAMLKSLGFTSRQLGAVVAWQASVSVLIGTVVGIPLGIVSGRLLWDLFAHDIHAVPAPAVPALTVALIGVGALVLANVVAALPGRIAARTSTAVLLRAE